jgi:GntR family transcriptional regulator/MocR family aminotransferase
VYERLVDCKRVSDLATSSLSQCALEAYITVGRYQAHLRRTCHVYRRRRDAMLEALARHMPPGARWISPRGGLFIWLQLPAGLSASQLYPLAAEEGVTFAPGVVFSLCECSEDHMRLNFSVHPPDVIEEGICRLGRAVERGLADSGGQVALVSRQQAVVV